MSSAKLSSDVGVVKIGNIVPTAGIEPPFWAIVLTITPPRLADVINSPMSTCQCSSLRREVSADYYTSPPEIVSHLMLTITYILPLTLHIHTQATNHTAHSLYRILVTAPQLWVWWKCELLYQERESSPHHLHSRPVCYTITPPRVSDATTSPTSLWLCSSLPERSL